MTTTPTAQEREGAVERLTKFLAQADDFPTTSREDRAALRTLLFSPQHPPEGWRVVPVEPTKLQLIAIAGEKGRSPQRIYRAALAAAPSPPSGRGEEDGSDVAPDSGVRGRLQVAPSPWRTIESAPKDAYAKVLGWCVFLAGAECRLVQRNHDGAWIAFGVSQNVTHWMPLPDGPTAQDETGGDATRSEAERRDEPLSLTSALLAEAEAVLPKLIGTLPVCPFDRRSPDYWTTSNDKPCHVCGGTEAVDKCRGADLRCMDEASDVIRRLSQALREARG